MGQNRARLQKGFSLIEILVVIAIIGILSGIILVVVNQIREDAKIAKARAEVRQIYNAMMLLANDTDQWPGHKTVDEDECSGGGSNEICDDGCVFSLTDCEAGLLCDDPADNYPNWNGSYAPGDLRDPWGNEYFLDTDYTVGGQCVVAIGSYGSNGQGLNNYDSDDILYIAPIR